MLSVFLAAFFTSKCACVVAFKCANEFYSTNSGCHACNVSSKEIPRG